MNTYETAIAWREKNVSTIPILWGSKAPAIASWRPYTERLPTMRELQNWFDDTGYNIAVLTGNGLVILDWDDILAYSAWHTSLNGSSPIVERTYRVTTSRGLHLYFWCSGNVRNVHGNGWDVKGYHGYCLTAPSYHPSGARYRGTGSIDNIQPLAHITELLPDYERAYEEQKWPEIDPFDLLMRTEDSSIPKGVDFEAIKARLPYESLLRGLIKRSGRLHAICPLHPDTHQSFVVYPDGGYYCFGCHVYGRDQIDLYAAIHRVSLGEAIRELV